MQQLHWKASNYNYVIASNFSEVIPSNNLNFIYQLRIIRITYTRIERTSGERYINL